MSWGMCQDRRLIDDYRQAPLFHFGIRKHQRHWLERLRMVQNLRKENRFCLFCIFKLHQRRNHLFFQLKDGLKRIKAEHGFPWNHHPVSLTLTTTHAPSVTLLFGIRVTQINCTVLKIPCHTVEATTWCHCVSNLSLKLRYAKQKSNLVAIMEIVFMVKVNVHVMTDILLLKTVAARNVVSDFYLIQFKDSWFSTIWYYFTESILDLGEECANTAVSVTIGVETHHVTTDSTGKVEVSGCEANSDTATAGVVNVEGFCEASFSVDKDNCGSTIAVPMIRSKGNLNSFSNRVSSHVWLMILHSHYQYWYSALSCHMYHGWWHHGTYQWCWW